MHLKNYSLITRNGKTELSPAYDLLNTTIALKFAVEESALPLAGKKSKPRAKDWIDYLAYERLLINRPLVQKMLRHFTQLLPQWQHLIRDSFLKPDLKKAYLALLEGRAQTLGLNA